MLTNTERQQIVEEVNAGTYGIDEALDDIAAAQKGEEVRKALYAEALVLNREGHAGSTDMIARQQIANLQTSVNGQISTLRTEVGDDIDDLETALNDGLATQNGKIAAQNATIANVVANYNVEYGSTELWASTGETGALAAGTTVTLSEDVSHFDYIDIYSFCGNSNVLDTVPVDAKLQSSQGYALRWVNLSDPDSGSYKAYVRIIETRLHIIGTTLTIDHQVTYRNGEEVNISGAEITQANRSTYVGELGIMKIVGRKITANTEVEDVRIGADGTEYASAGQAVRAQVNDLNTALDTRVTAVEGDVEDVKEDLSELSEAVGLVEYEQVHGTVESNKYIDGSGTVTTANAWSVETVEVDPDTEYVVTARAYNARYYFAFYTENNVFISGLKSEESGSTTIENYKVTAPSMAKYLSVVFYEPIQSQRKIKKKITPYSAKIVKAETELEQVESALIPKCTVLTNGTIENGKYIDGSGVITEIANWTIESFPVMPSATYKIKAQAYNARYYFAFYDVGGVFISGEKSTESGITVISSHIVTAPVNADTLVVVSKTSEPENRIAEYKEGFVPTGWHGKKWVVFGDSLTEENRRTTKHYFDYVADKTGITTYNMGNSGSGYASEYNLGTAFPQRIGNVPTDADVITIFGSFNDLSEIGTSVTLGTATDSGITTIGGLVNLTLDNLFTAFPLANVGLVTPCPWQGANPTNEPNTASAYCDLIIEICKRRGIPCLDLFHCSQLRPWEASFRQLAYSKDDGGGTHPDETGHAIIAPEFEAFLDRLLLH